MFALFKVVKTYVSFTQPTTAKSQYVPAMLLHKPDIELVHA